MEEKREAANFIEAEINKDIANHVYANGRVLTRFPPEPNGYLHIGHVKSICLNFGLGEKYHGATNVRFDDTNPTKENQEFVDSILEDVKWLGFKWKEPVHFASDYFPELYEFACKLIRMGLAYVDDQSSEEIHNTRGDLEHPGKESPWRNRSVEENLKLFQEMKEGKYDAVFLGVGAHLARRTYIPAGDASRVLDAVSVLKDVAGDEKPMLGRRVAIYGGGNTAIDVARTVRRMGAEPLVVYRRTRDRAPAHQTEIQEAIEEGVNMKWLSTIREAQGGEIKIEKMELDENGKPRGTGVYENIAVDTVVLALGQQTNLGFLANFPGLQAQDDELLVDETMMTTVPGIFAGGDMVKGDKNVTVAIGHGKKAARAISAYLKGEKYVEPPKAPLASFDRLHTWYYADAPKTVRPMLDLARRTTTFDEVQHGLTEENALFEARRCMSCGNCFECDNCYGVCPDNAVIKLGPGKKFKFNYDYCKGCGICANECPCGAIDMVSEDI